MDKNDDCDNIEVSNSKDKNKLILDFMSKDYENEMDRKNILDNKSSTLIAFTGVILTFQGGLTSLIFSNMGEWLLELKMVFLLIFIGSLFSYIVALYYFIKSYSIAKWIFVPVNDRIYYDFKNKNVSKEETIVETICFYNRAIKKNKKYLKKKANKIIEGMKYLQAGIILTAIYIIIYCVILM